MPRACEWLGLLIYIYNEENTPHHRRHVHVKYGEHKAVYDIDSFERMAGSLPRLKHKAMLKILRIHQQEFINFWENEQSENPVRPVNTINPSK